MGYLRGLHSRLKRKPASLPKDKRDKILMRRTGYLKEVPSKVGLSLTGFQIFVIISIITVLAFFGFASNLPKYDYITEKRLGDNYRFTFSQPLPNQLIEPQAHAGLDQPLITGMDQDKDRVFLGTRGHGIQALDKKSSLWKTYDAVSTDGELRNDISQVIYGKNAENPRLWVLGLDGSVTLGRMKGTNIDFDCLFAAGFWHYITREDITATLMIGSEVVIFGTSSKGAGAYNVRNHRWLDFPEIRDLNVKKILFTDKLLWFLTNQGIHVYSAIEGRKEGLAFRSEPKYLLKEKDLRDLRVFGTDHAVAFTEDMGCYIFKETWSKKLLGGAKVPGLSQESIRFSLYWENLIVVIGETFGVAGYDPELRRWQILRPGPLPTLHGFDYDEDTLALASDGGLYIIRRSDSDHLLQGESVLKASLWGDGCLYLLSEGGESKERVGWISPSGQRKTLISKSALNIPSQPRITDILFHQNKFWIGTESNGVILYSMSGRKLEQANISDRGQINSVKRLGLYLGEPLLLSGNFLYRWEEEKWTHMRDAVLDFKIDPQSGGLWLKSADGSLIRQSKDGEVQWFSGIGPREMRLDANHAAFSSSSEDPRIYYLDLLNRKMYIYNILRGAWDKASDIAGKHSFRSFIPAKDALYSVDPAGGLYRNEQLILGGSSRPAFPLNKALEIRQPAGRNSTVSIYGSRNRSDYEPEPGKWNSHDPYPFLKDKEEITGTLAVEPDFGGRLAVTSQNRLLLLDTDWQSATQIGTDTHGEYFDGSTFWGLTRDGSIKGYTIEKNQDGRFKMSQIDAFNGSPPDLSSVLEAWYSSPFLYLVTPTALSTYDTATHSWKSSNLPQKALKASLRGSTLQIVSADRLHSLSYPDLKGSSIALPSGNLKKVSFGGSETVITMGNGQSRRVYFQTDKSWTPIDLERTRFSGNFGAIIRVFNHSNVLWVYDPAGVCGRYTAGNWKSYNLPRDFKLRSFWEGPNNRLFLVGKRGKTDQVDLPLYYFGKTGFSAMKPLPAGIKAARIEQRRFLWTKTGDADIFIYDLANPQSGGMSLLNTCLTAKNGTRTAYFYDFRNQRYSKASVPQDDRSFVGRIAASDITDLYAERDPKTQALAKIFLATPRGMYYFKSSEGSWLLTAEFRVFGRLTIDEAMKRIESPGEQIKPESFSTDQAHFRLLLAEEGNYPFLKALKGEVHPGRFADVSQKEFTEVSNPAEVTAGGVRVVLGPKRPSFFALSTLGRQIEISHSRGQFETDSPIIDAAVDSSGQFLVLREKSLTTYTDQTLSGVVDITKSPSPLPKSSVLDVESGRFLLHMPDGDYYADTKSGELHLTKETVVRKIYANAKVGLKVTKEGQSVSVSINSRPFSGKERLPFDKIRKIGAEKHRLHLVSEKGLWTFSTDRGRIGDEAFLDLPLGLAAAELSFVPCSDGGIRLRAGEKLFEISNTLKESPPAECMRPALVASEDGWKWFQNPGRRGVYFEAQMGGKWQRLDREACEGCGFLDDAYSWVTAFGDRIYASHGLGVAIVSGNAKKKETLLGKRIEELKAHNRVLLALSSDSSVFQLSGENTWEPADKNAAQQVFSQPTTIYSDCLLQVESFHENIRIRTAGNQPLQYAPDLRKFRLDLPLDFASVGGTLYVIEGQMGRVVQFDRSGKRTECHPLAGQNLERLDARGGQLRAIGRNKVLALSWDQGKAEWNESRPLIELPGSDGLSFQLNLLSECSEAAICPVLAGHALQQFWSEGKFVFDRVSAIEGGSFSWWALSPAGILEIEDRDTAPFRKIHFPPGPVSRMAQRQGRLHLEVKGDERCLNEETGRFEPADASAFTRTVFDFSPGDSSYTWKAIEVRDADTRPTFYLNARGVQREDVFYDNRFTWDQIVRAAYDPVEKKHWLISPRYLSVNSALQSRRFGTRLSLLDFPEIPLPYSLDFTLADAVFSDGNLYTLYTNSRNEELVKKRAGAGWVSAQSKEYPFWYQAVEFNLRDNLWKPVMMTYSQFHSRRDNFTFIGPKDYPLFAELDWARDYGKFSFDYLLSIHPVGDTLWAGSKGGLVKFRYEPDKKDNRLELERIFLPEEGLNHYCVEEIKKHGKEERLYLLECDEAGEEIVQEVLLPSWVTVGLDEFPKKNEEYPFPGKAGAKYVFEYDPVRDVGVFYLDTKGGGKIELLRCARRSGDRDFVRLNGSGRYIARYGDDLFTFGPPGKEKGEAFSRMETRRAPEAVTDFTEDLTDPAGFSWGRVETEPALRTPSGEIFSITAVSSVAGLKVDRKALMWIVHSKDVEKAFLYSFDSGKVEELLDRQEDDIEWIPYDPPAGTGIFHYLENSGLIKEQSLLRRLIGGDRPNVERWVLIIAKKNNIQRGSRGKLDYPLIKGKIYLMPRKVAAVNKIDKRINSPLTVADRTFTRFGEEKKGHRSLAETNQGIWGFSGKDLLQFDLSRNRVFFEPFPKGAEPHYLWVKDKRILLTCDGKKGTEVWQFIPQKLKDSSLDPAELKRVVLTKGKRRLEASAEAGLVVDTGRGEALVTHSDEWFFGTRLGRVVAIMEDSEGNGYWIATDTSGLVWSRNPF
jgi:hypothetical protein